MSDSEYYLILCIQYVNPPPPLNPLCILSIIPHRVDQYGIFNGSPNGFHMDSIACAIIGA